MVPYPLYKHKPGCNSPHDRRMSLAMDLTACVICVGDYGTNGCYLAIFSEDVAFASTLWLPTQSIAVLVVLTVPVKYYLKWQAIRLAIHSIVGE